MHTIQYFIMALVVVGITSISQAETTKRIRDYKGKRFADTPRSSSLVQDGVLTIGRGNDRDRTKELIARSRELSVPRQQQVKNATPVIPPASNEEDFDFLKDGLLGELGKKSPGKKKKITIPNSTDNSELSDPTPKKEREENSYVPPTITYNEQAPDDGQPGQQGGGNSPGEEDWGPGKKLPGVMPFCLLIAPDMDEAAANQMIKQLAAEHAACGIVLEPLPFTTKKIPGSPDAINKLAEARCAHGDVEKYFGEKMKNSFVHTMPTSNNMADLMCAETPEEKMQTSVAGCAMRGGRVAIEDIEGRSNGVVMHEKYHNHGGGHVKTPAEGTPWGFGTGMEKGASLVFPKRIYFAHGDSSNYGDAGGGSTGAGCAAMQADSTKNNGEHFYHPNQSQYYFKETEPKFQYDMTKNESFLVEGGGSGGGPSKPQTPPRPGQPGVVPISQAPKGPPIVLSTDHKKRPESENTLEAPTMTNEEEFFSSIETEVGPDRGEGEGGSSVGFDEGAEEDGKVLSENFFDKGENPASVGFDEDAEDASDKLLSSVRDDATKRSIASLGKVVSEGDEAKGSVTNLDEEGTENTFGENLGIIVEEIANAAEEFLDSAFFSKVLGKKETAKKEERKIRVINGIY